MGGKFYRLGIDGKKRCNQCKGVHLEDHFYEVVGKSGKISHKCKLYHEDKKANKPIVKWCDTCQSRFEMGHFYEHTYETGKVGFKCKTHLDDFGNTKFKSTKGKFQPRKKSLEYEYQSPEYEKDRFLQRKFKITLKDYNRMFEEQNHSCAICLSKESKTDKNFHVDHCHSTNKVRGVLCNNCNLALGNAKDNTETIQKSIHYLENSIQNIEFFPKCQVVLLKKGFYQIKHNNRFYKIREQIKENQNNLCKICSFLPIGKSLSIDHCHKTLAIRGLLCNTCNTTIGLFNENIETMKNAIEYLNKHQK